MGVSALVVIKAVGAGQRPELGGEMDIVEQLRGIGDPWCKAAAAEIERLRARHDAVRRIANMWMERAEAAERERDRLREALNTMITLFGRSGDAFTDFEEIAALFQRETGKMRPGKDAPLPELAASHDEFRAWVSGHCVEAQKIVHETAQALAEDSDAK